MVKHERGGIEGLCLVLGCMALGCIGVPPPPPSTADTNAASGTVGDASSDSAGDPVASTSTTTMDTADESDSAAPLNCGDGVVDPDEVCDDGNVEDDDWCSADCLQANCLVPLSHVGVQQGIDDNSCSTLWIMPGVYSERLTVGRTMDIVPVGKGVVIDAGRLGRPLTVQAGAVTIGALELRGGLESEGGGIHNAGNLTLEGTAVADNLASADGGVVRGGGVYSVGALTLVGAQIHGNQALSTGAGATVFGGGVFVSGNGVTLTEGAQVTGNLAEATGSAANAGGGGIHVVDGSLVSDGDNRIEENIVRTSDDGLVALSVWGGGLYLRNSSLEMAGGFIHGNRAENLGQLTGSAGLVADGGGLYIVDSTANFDRTEISNNTTMVDGAGTASSCRGGGLAAFGLSDIEGTQIVFEGNEAVSDLVHNAQSTNPAAGASGGGVYGRASEGGDSVTIRLSDCRLESNRAIATIVANADLPSRSGTGLGGGALLNTGGLDSNAGLRFHRCLITGNRAEGTTRGLGGGVYARAGTENSTAWMSADNTTFSSNSTTAYEADGTAQGGGVYIGDGAEMAVTRGGLYFSTLTLNDAGRGGGLYTSGDQLWFSLTHTIVHGNSAPAQPDIGCFGGTIDSIGYNLSTDFSSCATPDGTDLVDVDPELQPLADNGGLSMTHGLNDGSPARDGGDPTTCVGAESMALSEDQRGEPRPAGSGCDIGAVEAQ